MVLLHPQHPPGVQGTNPTDGSVASAVEGLAVGEGGGQLVVVLPQLGDFDTAEYVEQLMACEKGLQSANLDWRVIGIGDAGSAARFCRFTSLPRRSCAVADGALHEALGLAQGPNWDVPEWCPENVLGLDTRAWLNYMAMCASLPGDAPGDWGTWATRTRLSGGGRLAEGGAYHHHGDAAGADRLVARLRNPGRTKRDISDQWSWRRVSCSVPFLSARPLATSSSHVPSSRNSCYAQTVRLRNMVEVLSNWPTYVPDDRHLAWRGATFLFGEDGELEHEHRTPGVLTYSATPSRPLSFLQPRIGNKALNPLGLADPTKAKQTAEAEEAMGFLKDQLRRRRGQGGGGGSGEGEAEAKVKAFAEAKKAEEEQRVSEREAALRRAGGRRLRRH